MRAKNIRIGYCRSAAGLDLTAEKDNARELDAYAAARRQGVQPAGTHYGQINFAMDQSERSGQPWDASQVGKLDDA